MVDVCGPTVVNLVVDVEIDSLDPVDAIIVPVGDGFGGVEGVIAVIDKFVVRIVMTREVDVDAVVVAGNVVVDAIVVTDDVVVGAVVVVDIVAEVECSTNRQIFFENIWTHIANFRLDYLLALQH